MQLHERIFELSLQRSFFFPSNEPYGQIAGFYDYGPVGTLLKQKIQNKWREMFIKKEGHLEIEASLITPEPVLIASGHVGTFADPVVECQKCKTRYRADHLVEKFLQRWDSKLETLDNVIEEKKVACPSCKGSFGKTFMFNLMFKTGIGGEQNPAYSRPETAQGTFTAFPRLFRNHGTKLPLAAGQVGRSFRNEISPRKGLVRMREFSQMELEYFFDPQKQEIEGFDKIKNEKMMMQIGEEKILMSAQELVEKGIVPNQIFAYYLVKGWQYYREMGIPATKMAYRVLDKNELPHYSKGNVDLEVETSYGTIETIGNAYRTDFDLSQHAKISGKDMSVHFDGRKIVPHVFEIAMGVDRLFYCILEHCFRENQAKQYEENGEAIPEGVKAWEWFDFHPEIAPYNVAIFPLMKKDGLAEKAQELLGQIRDSGLDAFYSESSSIGRRYAKADEIGIPYAITIDYDSIKDETVTIRFRNDGKQQRIKISDCIEKIKAFTKEGKVSL